MSAQGLLLGVNIDHVATLRQARGTDYPRPVEAALLAESNGADSITVHLREDRRHIRDADVRELSEVLQTRMNLEMAVTDEMLEIASDIRPADVCFVPERRQELTTEGGLDVAAHLERVREACRRLGGEGIRVSLFVDPEADQLEAAKECGASVVELHTGTYADAIGGDRDRQFTKICRAAQHGTEIGLKVHAGHGLNYENVSAISAVPEILELNIGHSIIAQAVFDGLGKAVTDMKQLMDAARKQ